MVEEPTCQAVLVLNFIKAFLREDPRRLLMDKFVVKEGSDLARQIQELRVYPNLEFPPCGTVGCIAGWICMIFGGQCALDDCYNEAGIASELLGTVGYKPYADRLFYMHNWPRKFNHAYYDAPTVKDRVEVTCERIDYFIKHLV